MALSVAAEIGRIARTTNERFPLGPVPAALPASGNPASKLTIDPHRPFVGMAHCLKIGFETHLADHFSYIENDQ